MGAVATNPSGRHHFKPTLPFLAMRLRRICWPWNGMSGRWQTRQDWKCWAKMNLADPSGSANGVFA